MVITINQKDLKPVLMEPKVLGIKNPYYIIREGNRVILVIAQGKNGVEFNKTTCFLSNNLGVNVYQCLYGQGILLMQRNDEAGEAKEFKVATLSQSKQVEVPAGLVICIINVGRNFLVVHGPLIENEELESKTIIERHGLAYYVVEKKGEIAFEQNPNYSVHPQISTE
ncbi:hypothetical protein A3B42_05170 [Candidatus Daviesbacteria bacterium RIFCSPLOWO2_01_FULL_38_10]|nr:MAG: hypothetical protein A3D02_00260 [Candidatus Daviesbacteria bacterium RIFCSPHIGHO2_02_FULL_39_41]OGE38981.1 MAG: hypothetical protein A3B42_05170 [Candidatus Daviesbacteria bacterium RIFCSPLOWO2_01_FULL_38_10]OGE45467.1 MAG: hypothetical protein A3E67_03760 [Candidatus Daviesbacteria bacterium RIFCSPHIGHO2_12_FULL_38_25]OGE67553.1 MAG: hypothetical protein A3H81_00905 [Candidatus Daviesbacteria bacterium RIFCSPLOWO2_02_FULL_38_18]OGE72773.1 MAG: hypothetical protein A3H18_03875 [Candida